MMRTIYRQAQQIWAPVVVWCQRTARIIIYVCVCACELLSLAAVKGALF